MGGSKCLMCFCKDKSLKAGWLKRLKNENNNSAVVNMYLNKLNIDINYMTKTTIKSPKHIQELIGLPLFWAQVFGYANECKTVINKKLANTSDLLAEPLWLNVRYKISGKPIFISNWAKSGIRYVKDIFDNEGNYISEINLINMLINKANWMSELSRVKCMVKWTKNNIDTSMSKYVIIKHNWTLLHNKKLIKIQDLTSKLIYNILIDQKSERNYMESAWKEYLS